MVRRVLTLSLLATAGLTVGCGAFSERPAGYEQRDFKTDPALRFKRIPLAEAHRTATIGFPIEFDGMLNRLDEQYYQPLFTDMKPEDFRNFSAFFPEAAVWDVQGRVKGSVATLFIHRNTPDINALLSADRYTPFRFKGVVRDNAESRAWIEVVGVQRLGAPWFNADSLGLLVNGLDSAAENKPADAVRFLNKALQSQLSPAGRAAAYNALGRIAHGLKDYSGAESYYRKALESDPNSEDARDGIYRCSQRMEPKPMAAKSAAPAVHAAALGGDPSKMAEAIEKLAAENAALKAKAEADTFEAQKAIAAESARANQLEAKVKELEASSGTAAAAATAKAAELEAKVKGLEDAAAAKTAETDAKIKGLEEAAAKAAETQKALEAERDDLKKKIETAGGDAAKTVELEAKIKALEEAAAKSAEAQKALEMERDDLKKKLETAGGDAAKTAELEAKIKGLEEAAAKSAEELKAATAERDELKKKLEAGAGGDTEAIKKQLAEAEARVAELDQKVKDRDETIKKLREEVDRLTEELKKKGE